MSKEICYTLYPCSDTDYIRTTTDDLSEYLYTQVYINDPQKCYWVSLSLPGQCIDPVSITVNPASDCCPPTCYYATSGQIFYVDADRIEHTTFGPLQFCSIIEPISISNATFTKLGVCTDGLCKSKCYKLVDCENIKDPLYTTSDTMLPYAIAGTIVTLAGYEGCWIPEISEDNCECAVNLIVNETFSSCLDCKGYISYRLTNCNDGSIIYTSSDLSTYINKTVEISPCAGCWFVEQLNYQGPSDQPVTVINTFDTCDACNTTYYLLTDCNGNEHDIITTTDLSAQVEKVITLKWCPDVCWSVTETRDHVNSTVVFPTAEYDTCPECIMAVLPCKCQSVINNSQSTSLTYIDCNNQAVTITVNIGKRSPKICAKTILTEHVDVIIFGDCIDNECPILDYPKATIIPGYNTPGCNADKFEKITCKASEILYKQVLQKRYGISNCCPEEDNKWLIKKELIDMAAMVDPDYTCSPSNTCNCPPSNCGCKTCNS